MKIAQFLGVEINQSEVQRISDATNFDEMKSRASSASRQFNFRKGTSGLITVR